MTDIKGKIAVAMSGGVDSSVAAVLLKEQGYDVFGITMELFDSKYTDNPRCQAASKQNVEDAARVCEVLGIPHHILDLGKDFHEEVIEQFISSYLSGKTPNPCILCNMKIKFGSLLDESLKLGADFLATGHYAKLIRNGAETELHKGEEEKKDQSYFLFSLTKKQLSKVIFPLGNMNKNETRKIAEQKKLPVANRSESQDICFIPDGDYSKIIPKTENIKGNIVHIDGSVLGQHDGFFNYTVGQRKGLGIGGGEILYVAKIDAKNKEVIVGSKADILCKKVFLERVVWSGTGEKPESIETKVKLRYRQKEIPAEVVFTENNRAEVFLKESFAGIAAGQGCAFYDGTRVIGGGWITAAE